MSDRFELVKPERSWGDATADVIGNMASTAAKGGRGLALLGAGVEAGMNNDNYQLKKARVLDSMEQIEQNKLDREERNKVYAQNELDRQRKNAEYATNEPVRESQRAAQVSRNAALYDSASQMVIDNQQKQIRQNMQLNPLFAQMTVKGQEGFLSSPEYQQYNDVAMAYRLYMQSKQNPGYQGALDKFMTGKGMSIEKDEKGNDKYLVLPGTDDTDGIPMKVEITQDNFGRIADFAQGAIQQEMQTRLELNSGKDNILLNTVRQKVREGGVAFENSYSQTKDAFLQHLQSYPEKDRLAYVVIKGYEQAFEDGNFTSAEKQSLFPQLAAYTSKMGISFDADRGVVFNDDGTQMSFQEYINKMKSGNTIDKDWKKACDARVENREFLARQKLAANLRNGNKSSGGEVQTKNPAIQSAVSSSEEAFKMNPELSGKLKEIQYRYNTDNPKKPLTDDTLKAIVGFIHQGAMNESNGDAEQYNRLFKVKLEKELGKYGGGIDKGTDLGNDQKIEISKIKENNAEVKSIDDESQTLENKIKEKQVELEKRFRELPESEQTNSRRIELAEEIGLADLTEERYQRSKKKKRLTEDTRSRSERWSDRQRGKHDAKKRREANNVRFNKMKNLFGK